MEKKDYYTVRSEQFIKETEDSEAVTIKDVIRRIDEMQPALRNLAEELSLPMQERRYDAIVGDDTAGRLPALFLGRIASRIAAEAGRDAPNRIFIAGGENLNVPEQREHLYEYIRDLHKNGTLGEKALVVTEYMGSGISASHIVNALAKEGVSADIATVSQFASSEDYRKGNTQDKGGARTRADKTFGGRELQSQEIWEDGMVLPVDTKIFAGTVDSNIGLKFHGRKEPAGTWTISGHTTSIRNIFARPSVMNAAREKIFKVADDTFEYIYGIQTRTSRTSTRS